MPGANINREFHFASDIPGLIENDKALMLAIGEIYSNKNIAFNCRNFTTTASLDITDVVCLCDTTGGAFTLTLPTANGGSSRDVLKSKVLILRHIGGGTSVTVTASGSDSIEGSGSLTLAPGEVFFLYSDGTSIWRFGSPRLTGLQNWTPTDVSGATLALTIISAKQSRIGSLIVMQAAVTYPATASGAVASIGGLSFAASALHTGSVSAGTGNPTVCAVASGATSIQFYTAAAGAITNAALSGTTIDFTITYQV